MTNELITISNKDFAIQMMNLWDAQPDFEDISDVFEAVQKQTGSQNSFYHVLREGEKLVQNN